MRADANLRVILALAQSILETLGSRESIQPSGRPHKCSILGCFKGSSSPTSPAVAITGPPSGAVQAVGTPFSFSASFTDSNTFNPSAQWAFDTTASTPGAVSGAAI